MDNKYPVIFTKDSNDTLIVTFPDFPEAITFGENIEDALFHAQNALTEAVFARVVNKEEIPCPSPIERDYVCVKVPSNKGSKDFS